MSGIQMALLGSGGPLDIQTVTTGATDPPDDYIRGWRLDGTDIPGAIVDGTSNIYSGATIEFLAWYSGSGGASNPFYIFGVTGLRSNSGWTTLTIGSKVLQRADATFFSSASTSWTWNTTDTLATQAFATAGSTIVCTFT
jgi:hypothetical protein